MPLVELEDETAHWSFGQGDSVSHTAGDDADLVRPNQQLSEFRLDIQHTMLGHNQEITIGAIEGLPGIHILAGGIDEDPQSRFHRDIPGTGDEP